MYLFSRGRTAQSGRANEAMGLAVEVAAKASAVAGIEVSAWASVLSPSAGTIIWSAWFEHLTDWEAATGKLGADTSYIDMVAGMDGAFTGPVVDNLMMLVHGEPPAENPTYVASVEAVSSHGHIVEAVAHGVALAEAATRIGGLTTMFAVGSTGPYGGVGWFTVAPDIASMEAGEQKVNSDPSFLALVDSGGTLYQPGAQQTMYRRLG